MGSASQREPATLVDWRAHAANQHVELIRGTLIEKALPTPGHAEAQSGTNAALMSLFRFGRNGGPGGWRFFTEMDVQFGAEVFRPDVCGYRRERMSAKPSDWPVKIVPDWVCEILSTSNQSHDRVEKQKSYFLAGVPHYWLIDPQEGTLEVLRKTDLAYAIVLTARRGERVRAEPFDAVELLVDDLLGVDAESA